MCYVIFWFLGKRSVENQKTKFIDQWKQDKLLGIEPGDYANVWFDFAQIERAVIIKHKNVYHLSIHNFDDRTKNWGNIHGVSVYDSLEAVRVSLFYDFDFYCEQNAVLDEHGNARFKECYNFE